jgi:hypothetical protein
LPFTDMEGRVIARFLSQREVIAPLGNFHRSRNHVEYQVHDGGLA